MQISANGNVEAIQKSNLRFQTSNALYRTDRQGIPLAMSEPVTGNHHDLFDI